MAGAPSPLRTWLAAIWRRDWRGLSLTYAMTAFEMLCDTLYPAVIGLAIDGLLAGRPWRMAPLGAVWGAHLVVGLARHVYDTRIFARVYTDLADDMVRRQRAAAQEAPRIVARVVLSRELVDFFQREVPALATAVIRVAGAVGMLFVYDGPIGVAALAALLPIGWANRRFARSAYRLNGALNNRLEREVAIVSAAPGRAVRRHFQRVALWRVRISNVEALTWGAVELVAIGLTLFVLLRLAAIPGVTPGAIYAVLAYVWSFYEGVSVVPEIVQQVARLRDIGERMAADGA